MSHLTTHKSQVLVNTKKELLVSALSEMGIELQEDRKTIVNSWINDTVDAAFKYKGKEIAVGIRYVQNEKGEQEIVIAGDFIGTGLSQSTLVDKVSQIYQKHNVIEKCREQRWTVDPNTIKEVDGNIVIQAYRYA